MFIIANLGHGQQINELLNGSGQSIIPSRTPLLTATKTAANTVCIKFICN
jgi:hypothetical protein